MASEKIKAIEKMRRKNDKAMTEKADIECNIKHFCWINKNSLNNLENISVQITSFHIKLKGLNNTNHQMQQENAQLLECLGKFEIIEEKLRGEVMTTQSEKHEILVQLKVLQNKIASATTDLTVIKYIK